MSVVNLSPHHSLEAMCECGAIKVLSQETFHSHSVSRPHYQCIAHSPVQSLTLGPRQPWGCTPRERFCEAAGGEESPPAYLGVWS